MTIRDNTCASISFASIVSDVDHKSQQLKILFSGDLGYGGWAIIKDSASPQYGDIVVMETTYGDRGHKNLEPTLDKYYSKINKIIAEGCNVIIPSFALELLYYTFRIQEYSIYSTPFFC